MAIRAARGMMPSMIHGQCYPLSDCLSIWAVLKRWPHISIYELERLINEDGDRPPHLQPYEVEAPSGEEPDRETMYLHPMRRGGLRIVEVHEFHWEVRDERGRPVASDCGWETVDENGEPMLTDFLWFLRGDVLRLEKENPDYLREIPPRGERAPAETPPKPARAAETPRPAGMMLRAKDAAARLSCSESHFWALVKRGEIAPGIKLSPKVTVWREETLEDYIRQHEAAARP